MKKAPGLLGLHDGPAALLRIDKAFFDQCLCRLTDNGEANLERIGQHILGREGRSFLEYALHDFRDHLLNDPDC